MKRSQPPESMQTSLQVIKMESLQKELNFTAAELQEQYLVNQELIEEKTWLMAHLYAFLTYFQMKWGKLRLETFLAEQQSFVQTQQTFILEDFIHEHQDLHDLHRFCQALPTTKKP